MNDQNETLAALYRRVSTSKQEESLLVQDAKAQAYAALKGFTVKPGLVFEDEAISGGVDLGNRPGGRQLLAVLQHGYRPPDASRACAPVPVHHVVVSKLDRLGRNAENLLGVWRWAKDHGVMVHIVDLGGESITSQGMVGKIVFGLLSLFAEFERMLIVERTRDALSRKFSRNELTGSVPFGFDVEQDGPEAVKRIVANEAEQSVLRLMGERRARGWSCRAIARRLNEEGFRRKQGGLWTEGKVDKVLKSKHAGKVLREAVARVGSGAAACLEGGRR